jgi:hypothetical protein
MGFQIDLNCSLENRKSSTVHACFYLTFGALPGIRNRSAGF